MAAAAGARVTLGAGVRARVAVMVALLAAGIGLALTVVVTVVNQDLAVAAARVIQSGVELAPSDSGGLSSAVFLVGEGAMDLLIVVAGA